MLWRVLRGRIISGRCFSLWLCWLVPSGGAASLFNAIDGSTIGVVVPAICSSASALVVTESAANLQMGRGACVLGWGGDRGEAEGGGAREGEEGRGGGAREALWCCSGG